MLNFLAQLILKIHKSTSSFREVLLVSHFGFISRCKHNPSCSDYFAAQVKQYGWRGFWRGIRRLFTCF